MFFTPSVGFSGGYVMQPAHFDAVSDYLTRGAVLTGSADSKLLTFSAWFKPMDLTTSIIGLHISSTVGGGSGAVKLLSYINNLGKYAIVGYNSAGTEILRADTGAGTIVAGNWYHCLCSINLGTGAKHIYLNDVSAFVQTTFTNDTIDFTVLDAAVGAYADGTLKFNGDIGDLWFNHGTYFDFSVTANRRKFISGSGDPVFLGLTGQFPTGAAPLVFMSQTKASDTWITNKGNGGGFTTHGTITRSQTSASNGYTPPAYVAEPVHFGGVNDYLTRGAALTGAADSKSFTFSFWVNPGDNGVAERIFSTATTLAGATERFIIIKSASNSIQIIGRNAAGTDILNINTGTNSVMAGNWYHVCCAIDLNSAGSNDLYLNGVSAYNQTTFTNDTIDFTAADAGIGAVSSGTGKFNGDLADFWFNDGTYMDLSVTANRRIFINASGEPVDLGELGEVPTGLRPLIYLHGDTSTWQTNDGSGGGFTLHGTLTTSTTSPSPEYAESYASIYEFVGTRAVDTATATPTAASKLIINSNYVGEYDYIIKDGPVTVSSFVSSSWFTTTADSRSALVVIKGDLTINAGQIFKPANRKLFTTVYVAGNCAINGELSMTARGANHSVTGSSITAADVRIANGTFSGITNPEIPATGGAGAAAQVGVAASNNGATGTAGSAGGAGGGGSGAAFKDGSGAATSGAGATGTSFSGGSGGGSAESGDSGGNQVAEAGYPDGGAGGNSQIWHVGVSGTGGAGNPAGLDMENGGTHGPTSNGTGGTLVLIVEGTLTGTGNVTGNGAPSNLTATGGTVVGGGGSGGGSVTVMYGADSSSVTVSAAGGAGGAGRDGSVSNTNMAGGAGGAGTARKLALPVVSLTNTDESASSAGGGSYNFTNQAIGTAAADRYIVVAVATIGNSSTGPTSVTVAGQATTKIHDGGVVCLFVTTAPVTTGTTATVVINTNASTRCQFGIWRLTGANPTPTDSDHSTQVTSNAVTCQLAGIPIRGAAMFYIRSNNSVTYSWANAVEDFDGAAGGDTHSGATARWSLAYADATVTGSSSPDPCNMIGAAFGPA